MIKLKIYESSLELAIEVFNLLKNPFLQYEYALADKYIVLCKQIITLRKRLTIN